MGIPGKTVGTMFTPVPFELSSHEPENVGGKCPTVRCRNIICNNHCNGLSHLCLEVIKLKRGVARINTFYIVYGN